jgi:acetate kinase
VAAHAAGEEPVAYVSMRVLVLNPGSSSLKSSVIDTGAAAGAGTANLGPAAGTPNAVAGTAAATNASAPNAAAPTPAPALEPLAAIGVDWGVDATEGTDPADDIRRLLARYEEAGIATASLGAVGYRVVHGGERFRAPTLVTPQVIAEVDALRALAPLHNGIAVATMRAGLAAIPQLPHVAVFDTAFHATLPEDAYRYAVPDRWFEEWGVRRYGFHGMSVEWCSERAAQLLRRPESDIRLVVAHLGSGCSVTAVDGGRSVATSMGLTPLEGLMMGTRSGSIDPGIMLYLRRNGWLTEDELAEQLDHDSGLVGVSGRTSDVRELLELESNGDERAALALRMFVRRAAECIAAAATSLPKLDAIVFTGGIGENAASLRARMVERLASIGLVPIAADNPREDAVLSSPGAAPAVLRILAREDVVVARAAARTIAAG